MSSEALIEKEIETREASFIAKNGGCRSSVPQDETYRLFHELYERLVHVPQSRRVAVISALTALYEINQ